MSQDEFDDLHKDSFVFGKPANDKPARSNEDHLVPKVKPEDNKQLDDYVPESVGKVVDNVFGKLDNLVSDAADYLFGNKPAEDTNQVPPAPLPAIPKQPQPPGPPAPPAAKPKPVPDQPSVQRKPTPKAKSPVTKVKQFPTMQSHQKTYIKPVMPESKSHIKGPVVSRTTSIADLNLPLEILDDPDLPRYFNQMKLYDAQVIPGGMCNMSQHEAIIVLKRGHWKDKFTIKFEQIRKEIDPGIYPIEMAKARFTGMTPVYKALAWQYSNKEKLVKAIQKDINLYLKKGKESEHFHKFIYQIVQPHH